MPLVYLGAYFGFHKAPLEFPNATSTYPRPIPFDATPWYVVAAPWASDGGDS